MSHFSLMNCWTWNLIEWQLAQCGKCKNLLSLEKVTWNQFTHLMFDQWKCWFHGIFEKKCESKFRNFHTVWRKIDDVVGWPLFSAFVCNLKIYGKCSPSWKSLQLICVKRQMHCKTNKLPILPLQFNSVHFFSVQTLF